MQGRSQPDRAAVARDPRLTVADHPLVSALMTGVRDARTPPAAFAALVHELTRWLLWQALADIRLAPRPVPGHTGDQVPGNHVAEHIVGLAILRAGLGMFEPMRQLLPDAPLYQIGTKRDEETLEPAVYYTNLPEHPERVDRMLILDPMLATGGSAAAALGIVRAHYSGPIAVLALIGAPLGVERLLTADPDLHIYLAALDDHLDDRGYIIPGLGDAGDRLFGTL